MWCMECRHNRLWVGDRVLAIWDVVEDELIVPNTTENLIASKFSVGIDKKSAISWAHKKYASGQSHKQDNILRGKIDHE